MMLFALPACLVALTVLLVYIVNSTNTVIKNPVKDDGHDDAHTKGYYTSIVNSTTSQTPLCTDTIENETKK
jgi:hypothetical protein